MNWSITDEATINKYEILHHEYDILQAAIHETEMPLGIISRQIRENEQELFNKYMAMSRLAQVLESERLEELLFPPVEKPSPV